MISPERKKQLMKELLDVECQLSPENLTCDGELPHREVMKRSKQLNAQKAKIIAELGYTPTDDEIWGQ